MIDDDLYSVCRILNIPHDEITKPFTVWRFTVLHVRGVDGLDTQEVYEYFDRVPHSIEWLSNITCNVTFADVPSAVNTLLNLANGLILHKNEATLEDTANLGLEVYTSDTLQIPVPPNYRYILGSENPKAKAIIIRFATINDEKPSQVEPRTTGVDLMKRNSNVDYDYRLPHRTILNSNNSIVRNVAGRSSNQTRSGLRMRMHADDEQEVNPAKNRPKEVPIWERVGRTSIRGRLGSAPIRAGLTRSSQPRSVPKIGAGIASRLGSRITDVSSKVDRVRSGLGRNTQVNKAKVGNIWRPSSNSAIATNAGDLRNVLNSRQEMLRIQVNYDD